MVVGYLNVVGVATGPTETDPPLVIDSYAVLTLAFPFQALESIRWWNAEVGQVSSVVQHSRLSSCNGLNVWWQALRPFSNPYPLGVAVAKGFDHLTIITRPVM